VKFRKILVNKINEREEIENQKEEFMSDEEEKRAI
jgi:hypothetical protein